MVALDGNPVSTNGGMATYDATFAPAAFLAFDGGTKRARARARSAGGARRRLRDDATRTRDVCVFNGELIVVEPPAAAASCTASRPTARPSSARSARCADMATACSSRRQRCSTSPTHPTAGRQRHRMCSARARAGPSTPARPSRCPTRCSTPATTACVDLVYVKKSGVVHRPVRDARAASTDSQLDGDVMAPFGFDGGVGGFIDGGVLARRRRVHALTASGVLTVRFLLFACGQEDTVIRKGMIVRTPDGEKLGRVAGVDGETFTIERGLRVQAPLRRADRARHPRRRREGRAGLPPGRAAVHRSARRSRHDVRLARRPQDELENRTEEDAARRRSCSPIRTCTA